MEKVLILDFGGQYTQLIAKIVRKCNVFSEIVDCDFEIESIKQDPSVKGIILSGGPDSVYEKDAPYIDKELLSLNIPVLGICYGMQLINHVLGGNIIHGSDTIKEYGKTEIFLNNKHKLFSGLRDKITVWMSHGDSVDKKNLAKGFTQIANSKHHAAAIADDSRNIYGVQFHPEVTHTPQGKEIISNFVHEICRCKSEWTMGNYIEECKQYIKETVKDNDVICFVSGGVDSAFTAAVLSQTNEIGKVHNVYVEALMRKNETEEVIESLKQANINLKIVKAEDRFIAALKYTSDPEEKRNIIGNLFGQIQGEVIKELNLDSNKTFLAQGTLYTDLIESGKGVGNKAAKIKSHHNVGCAFIEELRERGKIVEPNRLIFKDEVRLAAREIGLPDNISQRQPFPGPGLGVRIVNGNKEWVDEEFCEINRKVSKIAKEIGLEGHIVPIKTVGVQGDGRTYSFLAVLRGERDWNKIQKAAKKIPEEVHEVNRIVYDLNSNKISRKKFTEIIPATVTRETIDLLKDIDYEGREIIKKHGFIDKITQTIFILFGSDIHKTGKISVALRAITTDDFMTVNPVEPEISKNEKANMSWECLQELYDTLLSKYNVGAFVIDVTSKPPATTCWE